MNRKKTKTMGQHFLKNPGILRKIVQTISPQENDLLIEIGAGKGALTFPLARTGGKVIAIEMDKNLTPYLKKKEILNIKIVEKDILKIDFRQLIKNKANFKKKVKLVGNLPYSISSPLLFKVLAEREIFSECHFLLQKEFAERVCAKPRTKKFAPLSILFQIIFSTKLHFIVSPESFSPPPRVESALISLKKRDKPLFSIDNEEDFKKFLKGSFRHRRKTLFNNLIRFNYSPPFLKEAFDKLNLSNLLRPEELTICQFVSLFKFLTKNSAKDRS